VKIEEASRPLISQLRLPCEPLIAEHGDSHRHPYPASTGSNHEPLTRATLTPTPLPPTGEGIGDQPRGGTYISIGDSARRPIVTV
jgi:hypothetical protein